MDVNFRVGRQVKVEHVGKCRRCPAARAATSVATSIHPFTEASQYLLPLVLAHIPCRALRQDMARGSQFTRRQIARRVREQDEAGVISSDFQQPRSTATLSGFVDQIVALVLQPDPVRSVRCSPTGVSHITIGGAADLRRHNEKEGSLTVSRGLGQGTRLDVLGEPLPGISSASSTPAPLRSRSKVCAGSGVEQTAPALPTISPPQTKSQAGKVGAMNGPGHRQLFAIGVDGLRRPAASSRVGGPEPGPGQGQDNSSFVAWEGKGSGLASAGLGATKSHLPSRGRDDNGADGCRLGVAFVGLAANRRKFNRSKSDLRHRICKHGEGLLYCRLAFLRPSALLRHSQPNSQQKLVL